MNCIRCNARLESSVSVNGLCQDCMSDDLASRNQRSFGFARGWQCPICKNVLAPNTSYCLFCLRYNPIFTCNTTVDSRGDNVIGVSSQKNWENNEKQLLEVIQNFYKDRV